MINLSMLFTEVGISTFQLDALFAIAGMSHVVVREIKRRKLKKKKKRMEVEVKR